MTNNSPEQIAQAEKLLDQIRIHHQEITAAYWRLETALSSVRKAKQGFPIIPEKLSDAMDKVQKILISDKDIGLNSSSAN